MDETSDRLTEDNISIGDQIKVKIGSEYHEVVVTKYITAHQTSDKITRLNVELVEEGDKIENLSPMDVCLSSLVVNNI